MSATTSESYFESFAVGDVIAHRRGRTFSQDNNARWSLGALNTAQSHYNIEAMKDYFGGKFDKPIMNAGVVLSIAAGLSSEDISENVYLDLGYTAVRMPLPSFPGDTVWATSTVTRLEDDPECEHSGRLEYQIVLVNQRDEVVCRATRVLLVKRRSHWARKDEEFAASHW
jgi:acyl dehydratase